MAARNGITLSEMFHEETFERKLRVLATGFKKRFGDLLEYDVEEGEILLADLLIQPSQYNWAVASVHSIFADTYHRTELGRFKSYRQELAVSAHADQVWLLGGLTLINDGPNLELRRRCCAFG